MGPRGIVIGLSFAALCQAVQWRNVRIGGGGFVDGLVASRPGILANPSVYARTDVGGAYRLDGINGSDPSGLSVRHVPLNDFFNATHANWYGTSALAVSGNNGRTVFMAVGAYPSLGPGSIWRSDNGGGSFEMITPPTWGVPLFANSSPRRGSGERLAVHQRNDSVVLFGSFRSGLWRTADGGATWTNSTPPGFPGATEMGALCLLAMPSRTAPPGTEDTILAAVHSDGVYVSTSAGQDWARVPGSPPNVSRMAAAPSGRFVLAAADSGVYRSDVEHRPLPDGQGVVALPGPFVLQGIPGYGRSVWGSVDVNPVDEDEAVAVTHGGGAFAVARTSDGGRSWRTDGCDGVVSSSRQTWDVAEGNLTGVCSANGATTFLPGRGTSPPVVASGDMFSVWFTSDLGSIGDPTRPTRWYDSPAGDEEVFVLSLLLPATGPKLITGTADLGGFVHYGPDLLRWPARVFWGTYGASGGEGCGLDATTASREATLSPPAAEPLPSGWWETVPRRIVRGQVVASGPARTGNVITSDNGGVTWTYTAYNASSRLPVLGVAVGEHDEDVIVAAVQGGRPRASVDGGRTWSEVDALPVHSFAPASGNRYNQSVRLASDHTPERGVNVFVHVDCDSPRGLRVSSDGRAAVWKQVDADLPSAARCQVVVPHGSSPSRAGSAVEIFVAMGERGLFRVRAALDGSLVSFRRVPGWVDAHAAAFSVAPPGSACDFALMVVGTRLGGSDLPPQPFVSPDCGVTFVPTLEPEGPQLGNFPDYAAGSKRDPGLFVVGSFGRGAFFANTSSLLW